MYVAAPAAAEWIVMRFSWAVSSAAVLLLLLLTSGCSETESRGLAHPNVVIVRDFAAPVGVVTLDPSFGFSLNRSEPGVPPRQRGAAVARAASFALADTIVERLRGLGFDAVRSQTEQPEPGARALIVTGAFRKIDEGYRRQVGAENSNVAAEAQVQYVSSDGSTKVLLSQRLDSARLRGEGGVTAAAARAGGVDVEARKLGAEIARQIADVARRNGWSAGR
jgi:hypothetical protein